MDTTIIRLTEGGNAVADRYEAEQLKARSLICEFEAWLWDCTADEFMEVAGVPDMVGSRGTKMEFDFDFRDKCRIREFTLTRRGAARLVCFDIGVDEFDFHFKLPIPADCAEILQQVYLRCSNIANRPAA